MSVLKELEEFAKKLGEPVDELRKELEEIKKEYGTIDDRGAIGVLKSRYALKHFKETLKKEAYVGKSKK